MSGYINLKSFKRVASIGFVSLFVSSISIAAEDCQFIFFTADKSLQDSTCLNNCQAQRGSNAYLSTAMQPACYTKAGAPNPDPTKQDYEASCCIASSP